MKVLLVIGTILVVTQAVTFPELVKQEWRLFKAQHRKMYSSPSEEQARLRIYMENRNMIAEHNERYAKGEVTYMLQMNQFGDLSHDEFLSIMGLVNRTRLHPEIKGETYMSPADARSPTEVDWRKNGVVTPVKDQGDCGSCWSFSAAGAIEAQHFFKTGRLVSLSEQNLIDCSRPFGTDGCGGGWMDLAFSYVIFNGGIDTEESYPYEARNGYCRYKTQNRGATISSYVSIQAGNETLLKEAVANVGPIAVTLDASHSSFQFYSNGIYYEPSCSVTTPTHAVLVVGYGAEGNSDYWLVKNSYGTTWGTEGYFKIARNRDNHCGIGSHAIYPIV